MKTMELNFEAQNIGLPVDREDDPSVTTGEVRIRWLVNYQDDMEESPALKADLSETFRTVLERLYSNGTLKRTDSLWVVPLDNDARRVELIGAGRLRFDETLAHYPAYFAPGQTTVVNVVRAGTIAETGTLMEATRGVKVQNSLSNTGRDPQRYGADAITLNSLSDVPLTSLVVVTYRKGEHFIVSRDDLRSRITGNVKRMPAIEQMITNDRNVSGDAETAARQRLLDQLATTDGQPLARISAVGELPRPVFPREAPAQPAQPAEEEETSEREETGRRWGLLINPSVTPDESFNNVDNFDGLDINKEITSDEEGFRNYDFLHSLPDHYLMDGKTQAMIQWLNAGGNPRVTESRLDYQDSLSMPPATMWSSGDLWPYLTQVLVNGEGSAEERAKLMRMLGIAGADISPEVLNFTKEFYTNPTDYFQYDPSEEEIRLMDETLDFMYRLHGKDLRFRVFEALNAGHLQDVPESLEHLNYSQAEQLRNYPSLVYMVHEDPSTFESVLRTPYPRDVLERFRRSEMNTGAIKRFLDEKHPPMDLEEYIYENDRTVANDPPRVVYRPSVQASDETLLAMARAGQMAQAALYVRQNNLFNEQLTAAADAAREAGHQELADYLGNRVNEEQTQDLQHPDDNDDSDGFRDGDSDDELPEWTEAVKDYDWRLLDELRRDRRWFPSETHNDMNALQFAGDWESSEVLKYLLLFGNYSDQEKHFAMHNWSNSREMDAIFQSHYIDRRERERHREQWISDHPDWTPLPEYGYGEEPPSLDEQQQALLDAVVDGNLLRVRQLIAEGVDPDSVTDDEGYGLVMVSAFAEDKEMMELLLLLGADPDISDFEDQWINDVVSGRPEIEQTLFRFNMMNEEQRNQRRDALLAEIDRQANANRQPATPQPTTPRRSRRLAGEPPAPLNFDDSMDIGAFLPGLFSKK